MNAMCDLAIVGAGPAGQAAARAATAHGLTVSIIDDQAQPGGQIWRRAFADGLLPPNLFGKAYGKAHEDALSIVNHPLVSWRGSRTVWGLTQQTDGTIELFHSGAPGSESIHARRVLVAGGCHDMAVPFPGWTLPGVMGAGAIQAMLKGQGVLPGNDIILAGTHPLMLVIAAQLLEFGRAPTHVFFGQSRSALRTILDEPLTASRNFSIFAQGARAYWKLRQANVPIHFGKVVIRAQGSTELEGVAIASSSRLGAPLETVACDTLGFCYGFTACTELPRQIGADATWSDAGGGWVISHDKRMQSSVAGLYVAGETAGIGGEPCARAEGHLAGLAIAASLGRDVGERALEKATLAQRQRRQFAKLLQRLADPGTNLIRELRDDDTVICRCESVRTSTVRQLLIDNPTINSPDAVKLLARTGMGPCQGRFCHRAIQEEIVRQRGDHNAELAPFAARLPARPIPLKHFRDATRMQD